MIYKNVSVFFIFSFSLILDIIRVNGQLSSIGSECWSQTDCKALQMYCDNYRCACSSPYIPSQDLSACTIATGDSCPSSGTVCYDPKATCNSSNRGYCDCRASFVQHTETRVCLQALNQNCTKDGTACVDGSCENDKCQCPEPLVANTLGNRCVTAPGDNCVQSQECFDLNASCEKNGPCVCNYEYQEAQLANGSTHCARILGATCKNDEDCADENSFCETTRQETTICNCREGYVRSNDAKRCLAVPLLWPGSCEENGQCHGAFGSLSSCSSFACSCPVAYEYSESSGECILSTLILPMT